MARRVRRAANAGELFAASPYDVSGKSVEPVLDSSRYFVLRVESDGPTPDQRRTAYIGVGVRDVTDAVYGAFRELRLYGRPPRLDAVRGLTYAGDARRFSLERTTRTTRRPPVRRRTCRPARSRTFRCRKAKR